MELVLGRADSDDCDLAVTKKTSTNIRLGKVWVETEEYNVGAWFAGQQSFLAAKVASCAATLRALALGIILEVPLAVTRIVVCVCVIIALI